MSLYSRDDFAHQNFGSIKASSPIPDLLSIQLDSYEDFLQEDVLPEKRENKGLESVFKTMFPVEDNHRNYVLEYRKFVPIIQKFVCLDGLLILLNPLILRSKHLYKLF